MVGTSAARTISLEPAKDTLVIDTAFFYKWDIANDAWRNERKVGYKYNRDGQVLEEIQYRWITKKEEWQPDKRYRYSYEGQLVNWESQYWEPAQQIWINRIKQISSLNKKGMKGESRREHWSEDENRWVEVNADLFFYDLDNKLVEHVWCTYDTTLKDWLLRYRYMYTYNEKGLQAERVFEKCPEPKVAPNKWTKEGKDLYGHDDKGHQYVYISQAWDLKEEGWMTNWRQIYHNDDNGNKAVVFTEAFKAQGESYAWTNEKRLFYTYIHNKYVEEIVEQNYQETKDDWKDIKKEFYVYKPLNPSTTVADETRMKRKIEVLKIIHDNLRQEVTVKFQNPDKDVLRLQIIDYEGNAVKDVKGIQEDSITLDRSNLGPDLYVFKLSNDKGHEATYKVVMR